MKRLSVALFLGLFMLPRLSTAQAVLRHDVFAPPTIVPLAKIANTAEPDAAVPEIKLWAPRLSSVVNAGKNSMVVLNGTVLRLNDSMDGYRLVQIGQREAVFSKDGEQIVVGMTRSTGPANAAAAKDRQ